MNNTVQAELFVEKILQSTHSTFEMFCTRDPPFSFVHIQFGPLALAQFARPHEHEWSEPEGAFSHEISLIRVNRPQQLGDTTWVHN